MTRRQDIAAGAVFVAFGAAALAVGWNYPMGSATRMGPGYFSMLLAAILVGFGIAVALAGLRNQAIPFERMALRPAAAIVGAILAFAVLLPLAGLVPASAAVVVFGSLGNCESRPGEVVLSALLLSAFNAALFVWGLGLTINLFW